MDVGELVSVAIILDHSGDCDLCKEPPKEPAQETIADPDWEDDPAQAIDNNSGKLDSCMNTDGYPRPNDWEVDSIGGNPLAVPKVTPNPHHLIPGNESLKVSDILDWIFGGPKTSGDIGYDVNNGKNGVWLPSNNSMRGNADWSKAAVKREYVIKSMEVARGHFHDRHADYSNFVTKILNKMAARMNGIKDLDGGCPYKTEVKEDGKFKPPYYLVVRLNGVSGRMREHLRDSSSQRTVYTSKLVKDYYWPYKDGSGTV